MVITHFQHILPCNYNRKYYTCLDAGHDNLLNRQFKSECGVDHSSFSSSENITEVNGSTLKKPKSTSFFFFCSTCPTSIEGIVQGN